MEDKRYVKAQESFQFAMDVEPNGLHRAYLTWAEFMQNPMRRFEDAVETLEVLIKKEPDRDVLHYIFAQVYRQMGDFDSALRELKHTKRCNPSHVSADKEMREIRTEMEEKTKKKKKRRFF